jgi:PhnB protein
MPDSSKPVPERTPTITPHLTVRGASQAIEFYQQAFGAQLAFIHKMPDGKVMHATMRLGNSRFQLADELQGAGAVPPQPPLENQVVLNICVKNVDEVFHRALAAGAKVIVPLANQFWGARYGQIVDPFGQLWAIFCHIEDVSPGELEHRANAAFADLTRRAST